MAIFCKETAINWQNNEPAKTSIGASAASSDSTATAKIFCKENPSTAICRNSGNFGDGARRPQQYPSHNTLLKTWCKRRWDCGSCGGAIGTISLGVGGTTVGVTVVGGLEPFSQLHTKAAEK